MRLLGVIKMSYYDKSIQFTNKKSKIKNTESARQFCRPRTPLTPKGNSAHQVPPWGARGCVADFYFQLLF